VLSGFKETTHSSEVDVTTATARLPSLDIEIVHRRSPGNDREQISINLQAVPSFEAFGRFLEAADPFAFWAEATKLIWFSWLEAACAVMISSPSPGPQTQTKSLPPSGEDTKC